MRNVLLQKQANGLVAKLIGFGPLAEDMDSASDKSTTGVSYLLIATPDVVEWLRVTVVSFT